MPRSPTLGTPGETITLAPMPSVGSIESEGTRYTVSVENLSFAELGAATSTAGRVLPQPESTVIRATARRMQPRRSIPSNDTQGGSATAHAHAPAARPAFG
jgi:hypothetical protein